jgi:hypothetical protein
MGVVRFAIRIPHTFYVVAAPIRFLGMTAGIKMPTEILHARDLMMKGVQFSKVPFLPVWRETGQTFSTQERAALEWAETLTLISETHAPEEIYRDIAAHFTEKEMVDLTIAIGLMKSSTASPSDSAAIPPPHDMRSST